MRFALLLLLAIPARTATESCELVAVDRWNRFSATAARYLNLRQTGVKSLKERERMEREFRAVMSCECF